MSSIVALGLLIVGLLFNLLGCIGMVRLPDVYNRLQAATKCVTLGTCMVLASVAALAATGAILALSVKSIVCIVFILIASPTAAHALARGAHASGIRLWEKSVVDQFETDGQPGLEKKENPE